MPKFTNNRFLIEFYLNDPQFIIETHSSRLEMLL